jgi:two-component system copper resistance phosphate regulon response regulator CusR
MVKESRINIVSFFDVACIEDKEQYWKRMLIVDDDPDITTTFKFGIETANETSSRRIIAEICNDPRLALLDFQPNFYDLLLIDINMPHMNGFQLSERILAIDINVKICFMSSGEINLDAMREIHPSVSFGCFIRKPVSMDHLIDRIIKEMD